MYRTLTNFKLYVLFFAICFAACDVKNDDRNKIIAGKWFITAAEKDGSKIRSLEGTIFEFTSDGKMTTNVPNFGSGNYEFGGNRLFQTGATEQDYTVEDLTTEKLILKVQVRGMDFKMFFGRDSSSVIE